MMASESWGMVIFSTPYLVAQLIIIKYDGNVPPTAVVLRQVLNGMTQNQWDVLARYPASFEPTLMLSEGTGTLVPVTGPPFEITVLVPAAYRDIFNSDATAPGWTYFRKWRTVYKGHTVHLNAPDLANQGRIIAAASATESSIKNVSLLTPGAAAGDSQAIAMRYTVSPPYFDNILAQQDTNARQDIIKKGEYIQQRLWNKVVIWNEGEDVRGIHRAANAAVNGINVPYPAANLIKRDGFDLNLGWFVENIRGLSALAEIHIKHRVAHEFNCPGTSPWQVFARPCPPADQGALNLYFALSSLLPHAYDSAFNDAGLLSSIITKCIGSVAAPALRSALSAGAGLIHSLVDRGISSVDRKLQKYSTMTGSTEYGDRGYT